MTSEYIYTTYGIQVEDNVGDEGYVQKSSSQHELELLNEVLKELPQEMLESMAINRIVRNGEEVGAFGTPTNYMGLYLPCNRLKESRSNCLESQDSCSHFYSISPHPFWSTLSGSGAISKAARSTRYAIHR